jgi:5-methylthioadenosine/S-adenosylhomocysteine deaminase
MGAATLVASAELGRRYDVPVLVHLAETEDEVRIARDQYQLTPVGYLDSIGFLGPRTLAAHGIWVTDDDIQLLNRRAVGVSHNPESNMKLASGTAPVTKYLAAGVALGLGTDGAASNNDMDMFEAMRQATFLAKLTTRDPTAVLHKPRSTWRLSAAPGRSVDRLIGSLETGKRRVITVSMGAARDTLYDAGRIRVCHPRRRLRTTM